MGGARNDQGIESTDLFSPDALVASRYRLLGVLGQGAMGLVWRAHDTVLDRHIAIKELCPAPGVEREEALGRFLVEARAAARLNHPNIVGVHDVFVEADRVLIAMELIEGETLDQLVSRTGALAAPDVRAIVAQVAQALQAAHEAGVIHRDLKPDNIFWTAERRAVVGDFGLARIGAGRGTRDGTVMGTPGYMAPEQVKGTPTSAATDVFGWGAVAYALATGSAPFGEPSSTDPTALAYRIVHEEPSPLQLAEDPHLAGLVTWALSKSPDDRPADGAGLVRALSNAAAIPNPSTTRSATAGTPTRRWLLAGAAIGVLLAAAVAVAVVLSGWPRTTRIVIVPASTAQSTETSTTIEPVTTVSLQPPPTPPTTEAPPQPAPEVVAETVTTVARSTSTASTAPVTRTPLTSPPVTAAPVVTTTPQRSLAGDAVIQPAPVFGAKGPMPPGATQS